MKALHLTISGHVQAVGFRAFVKRNAKLLGLTGWVKNCDNGNVEVLAQGDEEMLHRFQKICSVGPPIAKVDSIGVKHCSPETCSEFSILRSE